MTLRPVPCLPVGGWARARLVEPLAGAPVVLWCDGRTGWYGWGLRLRRGRWVAITRGEHAAWVERYDVT